MSQSENPNKDKFSLVLCHFVQKTYLNVFIIIAAASNLSESVLVLLILSGHNEKNLGRLSN